MRRSSSRLLSFCFMQLCLFPFLQAQDTIHVTAGWNLMGATDDLDTSTIATFPQGLIASAYFGYAPGTGYSQEDSLQRGYGYWVKVNQDGLIVLPASNSSPTYTIGLNPELGGYVFYVSADGKHGLVAATQDQGITDWYNAPDSISNPANYNSIGSQFRDWRFPTKHELNELYQAGSQIGGFANAVYWCSTEYWSDDANAWSQYFEDGNQLVSWKSQASRVRAVRAF
jgi:hypothetical protein